MRADPLDVQAEPEEGVRCAYCGEPITDSLLGWRAHLRRCPAHQNYRAELCRAAWAIRARLVLAFAAGVAVGWAVWG